MNNDKKCIQLDLTYYKGEDLYTDGDIEDEILKIVRGNEDIEDVLKNDNRWPVFYHLTSERRNLLEWYDFKNNASLLEIGSGCGALTGLFGENVSFVQSVELSKKRATIAAYRHKELNNINIKVGNLNDMQFDREFDYVTLIGVLEYAGKFTEGTNPYRSFLVNCKKYLKANGTLIIAIENKYGLKYWAGAKEDHTGKYFDGIEGYMDNPGVRTFGKTELIELISSAGFDKLDFYYPMPDYKIPTQVFSDDALPKLGQIGEVSPTYDSKRMMFFDELAAMDGIIKNSYFDIFANSYLIFCHLGGKYESAF